MTVQVQRLSFLLLLSVCFGFALLEEWIEISTGITNGSKVLDAVDPADIFVSTPTNHYPATLLEDTLDPTVSPTFKPTTGEEGDTTNQPTNSPHAGSPLESIFYSPTWKSRNQDSFAFSISNNGAQTLYVYGNSESSGGNMTLVKSLVNDYLESTDGFIVKVVSSLGAFAALFGDGKMAAWGLAPSIAGWENYAAETFSDLVATDKAFAGLTTRGRVVCFGAASHGGVIPAAWQSELLSEVVGIASASAGAFAAWKSDGTVYTWGNRYSGGGVTTDTKSSLFGIVSVVGSEGAFVGVRADGSFTTWGNCYYGGCYPSGEEIKPELSLVVASPTVFIGYVQKSSELVTWGMGDLGGEMPDGAAIQQVRQFDFVLTNRWSVAAFVNGNTSVLCWGDETGGGDCAGIPDQLDDGESFVSLAASEKAYAAVTSQGRVFAWGDERSGGSIPSALQSDLSSGVLEVVGSKGAFAARTSAGSVVAWGNPVYGGSTDEVESLVKDNVVKLLSSSAAFIAVLEGGGVVGWGHELTIESPGLLSPLVDILTQSEIIVY